MNHHVQRSRLSESSGVGVCCNTNGLFVGEIPLLEKRRDLSGEIQWRPRVLVDLNRDLGERYGLPVDCTLKMAGLDTVARALDRGDLAHAQIATLHMRFPEPIGLAKSMPSREMMIDLALRLRASGLLKATWDSTKHPRQPAKSPGGIGGEFAPAGGGDAAPTAPMIEAQLTIPAPLEPVMPRIPAIPIPPEITFPPLVTPNMNPKTAPRNPYPNRPECIEEWAQAEKYCEEMRKNGLLGQGGSRGIGRTFRECVMGQVSEDCGGNQIEV